MNINMLLNVATKHNHIPNLTLIWVQIVCKLYQKTTLPSKEIRELSVKQVGDYFSGLIWVQTVCKV